MHAPTDDAEGPDGPNGPAMAMVSRIPRALHDPSQAQMDRETLRPGACFLPPCVQCARAKAECRECRPRRCGTCGSTRGTASLVRRGTLYGLARCEPVDVFDFACDQCNQVTPYDGFEDGVVNLNNSTLMHEEVPRGYWDTFFNKRGGTFSSYHGDLARKYEHSGSTLLGRTAFIRCMHGFLDLVGTDETVAMRCPVCRWLPDDRLVLLFDGIEQGMPLTHMAPAPAYPRTQDVAPDHPSATFQIVNDRGARALLKRYVHEDVDFDEMRGRVLRTTHGAQVAAVLDHARAFAPRAAQNRCPRALRRLVACLASTSPARDFLTLDAVDKVDTWTRGVLDAEHVRDMTRGFPALADALTRTRCTQVPDFLKGLLGVWVDLAKRPARAPWYDLGTAVVHSDELWVCAPQFQAATNVLPTYAADRAIDRAAECTKFVRSSATLTDGAVTVQCPHGLITGFVVLHRHESPRTVFEFMRRKMRQGPRMVVYDNGCALEFTCLKRDPAFFCETKFCVDRFHYGGHTACGEGKHLDTWAADTPMISADDLDLARAAATRAGHDLPAWAAPILLGEYNSSAAEQNNARLRNVSTQMAYMTHEHYVKHLRQLVYRMNVAKLARASGQTEKTVAAGLAV